MLKGVLPRILPDDVTARFIIFKGKQESKKYRTPDHLANPVQELRRLTGNRYQKMSGSRDIGVHLRLSNNRSHSFMTLISGIKQLMENN